MNRPNVYVVTSQSEKSVQLYIKLSYSTPWERELRTAVSNRKRYLQDRPPTAAILDCTTKFYRPIRNHKSVTKPVISDQRSTKTIQDYYFLLNLVTKLHTKLPQLYQKQKEAKTRHRKLKTPISAKLQYPSEKAKRTEFPAISGFNDAI